MCAMQAANHVGRTEYILTRELRWILSEYPSPLWGKYKPEQAAHSFAKRYASEWQDLYGMDKTEAEGMDLQLLEGARQLLREIYLHGRPVPDLGSKQNLDRVLRQLTRRRLLLSPGRGKYRANPLRRPIDALDLISAPSVRPRILGTPAGAKGPRPFRTASPLAINFRADLDTGEKQLLDLVGDVMAACGEIASIVQSQSSSKRSENQFALLVPCIGDGAAAAAWGPERERNVAALKVESDEGKRLWSVRDPPWDQLTETERAKWNSPRDTYQSFKKQAASDLKAAHDRLASLLETMADSKIPEGIPLLPDRPSPKARRRL